jgi:hypothetical protein
METELQRRQKAVQLYYYQHLLSSATISVTSKSLAPQCHNSVTLFWIHMPLLRRDMPYIRDVPEMTMSRLRFPAAM